MKYKKKLEEIAKRLVEADLLTNDLKDGFEQLALALAAYEGPPDDSFIKNVEAMRTIAWQTDPECGENMLMIHLGHLKSLVEKAVARSAVRIRRIDTTVSADVLTTEKNTETCKFDKSLKSV